MTVLLKNHNILLDRLFEQCDDFPASSTESTMLYNYVKLMNILQEKEMAVFSDDPEAMNGVYDLTRLYGIIANDIVRKGADDSIIARYNDLEQTIERTLSGNLYIYAKQWGLSVKALYHYKLKHYEKAHDFTLECIALNEYLIREGVHTLLFRSAEQNRNLSRILFRSGDWERGSMLAHDLIDYLLNGEAGNLRGAIFKEPAVWEAVPYVREGYAYECFRGMVSHYIHFNKSFKGENPPDIFPSIFGELSFSVDTPDRKIMHDWLYLKSLYNAGEYDEFLQEFIDFMSEPMSQLYDILKISLFQDVIRLIEKSGYPDMQKLLDKIRHYLEVKLNIHEHLRRDISTNNLVNPDIRATRNSA